VDHIASEFRRRPCQGSTNLVVHLWIAHLHSSSRNQVQLLEDLSRDRSHRWIGLQELGNTQLDSPRLLLYPTLTKQFTNTDLGFLRRMPRKQYPRLISFFGDTGAGKSTIVKNLIRNLTSSGVFETPVVGSSVESHLSISGGVHVYTDPGTFTSDRPLIYAGEDKTI